MRMIVDGRGQYFPGDNSFPTLARQMDHDLRSPLTAICSYAECLAWLPGLEPSAREQYALTILTEARRLGRLAGNFLVLAAPPLSNELDEIDLGQALTDAVSELADFFALHECELDWQRPADLKVVWPQLVLQQLLHALLEAGLEARGTAARLRLEVEAVDEETLRLEVSCDQPVPARGHETFAYRAVQALLRQRGGEVSMQAGAPLRLTAQLPIVGRVKCALEQDYLEKSA